MGHLFDYHVSFRVTHPVLDPAVISASLGLEPRFSWRAGEPRATPEGSLLGAFRKETYCSYDIGGGDDGELAKCLSTAVDNLERHAEFLREVRASGGMLMFYVCWHPNGDQGETFRPDLMRKMADLGIEFGLNVFDDRLNHPDEPRITISTNKDGELEMWLNQSGRDRLVRELQSLRKQHDHFHLAPDDLDGEVPLRSIAYGEGDNVIQWGKVMLRPDEWDAEHFPHVLQSSEPKERQT
jgi:hypothetical protein